METPDDYLVSLDAKTGKERWHKEIADFNQQYFSTLAPIVVGNHVLVGTGNDIDSPGFLQSFDPETGELQWKFYTVPMNPGDPGLDTWPSLEAARHGGAPALASRRLRSRDEALHLRHRQSDAGLHVADGPRRGRQPLHLLAHRRQRRHRQDGVVFPDLAARHARLGFRADAGPDRRHRRASSCRRRRATAISSRSIASRASTSSRASTERPRTGRRASPRTGRCAAIPARIPPSPGRSCRRRAGGTVNWEPPAFSPDTGPVLRAGAQRLLDLLPDRSRSARLDGARRQGRGQRRQRRQLPDRDRLQDRKGRVAASVIPATAAAAAAGCSRRRGSWSSPATPAATSSPTTRRPASRCGIRTSAASRTRRRPYLLDGRQYVLVAVGDTLCSFTS